MRRIVMIGHRLSARLRPDVEAAPWVISEIEKLEAELEALRELEPAIPESYVLMPIRPNDAMLEVILNTHDVYGFAADLYEALIAAAQEEKND
jgi:hypothetical protein